MSDPKVTSTPPDVHVRGLIKTYPGETTPTLKTLDVTCPSGKITVVVGPSGCGKSTFLRCVCGLEQATGGTIHFGNRDVTKIAAERRGVAMVFQNYALYPDKTVAENIGFPLKMAGLSKWERDERVLAAARLVRIEDYLERRPANLSGGQRQRVGIARAIVRGPDVLLMDEPLSNLDSKLRTEMRAELSAIQKAIGATTVYVTHDQTEALTLADKLIVLDRGIIAQEGTPSEVFQTPKSTYVADFLGRMNLIEVTRNGNELRTAAGEPVRLPDGFPATLQKLTLGFRAEEVSLGDTPEMVRLSVRVEHVELLGTEKLVLATSGNVPLRVRVPVATPLAERLDISIAPEKVHLFSPKGERL